MSSTNKSPRTSDSEPPESSSSMSSLTVFRVKVAPIRSKNGHQPHLAATFDNEESAVKYGHRLLEPDSSIEASTSMHGKLKKGIRYLSGAQKCNEVDISVTSTTKELPKQGTWVFVITENIYPYDDWDKNPTGANVVAVCATPVGVGKKLEELVHKMMVKSEMDWEDFKFTKMPSGLDEVEHADYDEITFFKVTEMVIGDPE